MKGFCCGRSVIKMKKNRNYEIDMCSGALTPKMLAFAAPLMLTGILQLLYNAADIIVVGRFAGKEALAAVGSTGALVNLLVNIFMGLSVGASVAVSNAYGAGDFDAIEETVHTAISIAAISGLFISIIGILFAKPLLSLMGTPTDVIDGSTLYLRIFFVGMPANMLYNFGSAILRAIGDTRRPLYFLTIAGVFNIILNLVFVIKFDMSVAGVALATVIAQCISMILVLRCLLLSDGAIRLSFKKLHIHKDKLVTIAKVGLPAGVQGSLFSISNVLIQSSINSFGSIAMAGNAAASNLEGFVYTCMNSIYQTDITFSSQNMGAKQYKRVRKVLFHCIGIVSAIGIIMGVSVTIFGNSLLRLYNDDPQVIAYGIERLMYVCLPYFLCGIMDVMVGQMRGIGYSVLPMIVSLTGACAFRILWIYTIFAQYRYPAVLYLSYPASWALTALIHIITYLVIVRKLPKIDFPRPSSEDVALNSI